MRPITITRQLAAAAVGAICAAQTTAGAGNLLINGSLASGGVATLSAQQNLGVTSAGNLTGVNFTFFGTDDQNRAITETLAGPNAGTVQTTLNYRTVTAITVSGAVGTNVTVDTIQIGASQEIPIDLYISPQQILATVVLTGSVQYTLQYTTDNVFGGGFGPYNWFTVTGFNNLNASSSGQVAQVGITALRLLQNSTGKAVLEIVQAGLTNA